MIHRFTAHVDTKDKNAIWYSYRGYKILKLRCEAVWHIYNVSMVHLQQAYSFHGAKKIIDEFKEKKVNV